jgi:TRAP-type C4-dicarboxylate transport system substrate-binding protein
MKKVTTILCYLLIGALAMAVLAGGAQAQEKKYVAKLADVLTPDHPHTRSWVYSPHKVK